MLLLTYRQCPIYFYRECSFEDIVKNENCLSYAVCRLQKSCFKENAFKFPSGRILQKPHFFFFDRLKLGHADNCPFMSFLTI